MKLETHRRPRKYKLHHLIPFYFAQEGYHYGRQVLAVWRWGRLTWEVWDWNQGIDIEFFYDLQKKGATDSELYDRIKFSAKLVATTRTWELARGYC